METRAQSNPDRFRVEQDAERYAEYIAMGWREPEAHDVGKVVFDRSHRRTEANLIRAREILKKAFLSRHEEGADEEAANIRSVLIMYPPAPFKSMTVTGMRYIIGSYKVRSR